MNTIERARNRWREILPQLGIETRFLQNRHGPCPLCGGRDRYRFDDKDGSGSYYCHQCGAGAGLILIRKLNNWDFKTACDKIDEIIGRDSSETPRQKQAADQAKEKARRLARINRTLSQARDTQIVAAFLKSKRLAITSTELRGHPDCEYFDDGRLIGRFPAIVAPIRSADGEFVSAAVLYGSRAPEPRKKFLPKVETINGAAVRLYAPENGHLWVAEGIATAMAARQLFGTPTWSLLSANGIKSWSPPDGITRVTVYADNDENYTGQAAAYDFARRLRSAGTAVDVMMPNAVGTDFADLLPDLQEHGLC